MHSDHKTIWIGPDNRASLVPDHRTARAYGERVIAEARMQKPSLFAKMMGRAAA